MNSVKRFHSPLDRLGSRSFTIITMLSPALSAQHQNSTQKRESALEATALKNISKFQSNGAAPAAGDNTNNMRMVANCQPGNHDCTYTLSNTNNTYYVWEHQTEAGGGPRRPTTAPNSPLINRVHHKYSAVKRCLPRTHTDKYAAQHHAEREMS